MKKIFSIVLILFFSLVLSACDKSLSDDEIHSMINISNESIKPSVIVTNGKYAYIVEFNLKNKSNYNLTITGNVQIIVNGEKVKDTFIQEVPKLTTVVVKVYVSSSVNSYNLEIDFIDVYKATYK